MGKVLLLLLCFSMSGIARAQVGTKTAVVQPDSLPYLKYPTLPAFNVLLTDSSTIFNTYNISKGRPVALMLFDPECGHCRKMVKEMTQRMDSLKDVRFYLFTSNHSMQAIRKFVEEFGLSKYQNIEVVGQDYEFFFISFFKVRTVPGLALYDGRKKLVKLIDSQVTVDELLKYTHGLK